MMSIKSVAPNSRVESDNLVSRKRLQQRTDTNIMSDNDKFVMAQTMWGEARGESSLGQEAVAWVIKNRRDDGR